MPPQAQRLKEFIKAANDSLTRKDFNTSFAQVVRMVKLAIAQLDARITKRLSELKDGYTPVKGKDYFDGKPGYTPVKGKDYFDGKTPVAGVDFPLPKDGEPGPAANAQDVIPQIMAEIDKRFPLLGDALRAGLEQHVKETIAKHPFSMGGGAVVSILQSGVQKVQQAAILDFKGTGAPTVTIGNNGVTHLDFPGSGGTPVYDEVVSGNTNTFTLAHTPIAGSVRVYGIGQRLVPTTEWTISGAVITTVNPWTTGQIVADYAH